MPSQLTQTVIKEFRGKQLRDTVELTKKSMQLASNFGEKHETRSWRLYQKIYYLSKNQM